MNLQDRVALITGGAKGIGLATAEVFLREGAKVMIADLDASAGQKAAERLGRKSSFISADVSKTAEVKRLIEGTTKLFGRIDFLINSAGIVRYATAVTCTEEEWDEVLGVNLKSSFLCCKYAIPAMNLNGVIINVASAQAHISSSNMVHYTTAKSALLGFTRSLAIDFAPSIRAIAVCPGTIDTPMARNAWALSENPEAVLRDSIDMHILKRIGKPEEVAELIVFLCSDKAAFITGQYIRIDGGLGINVPGSVNDARETQGETTAKARNLSD